MTPRDLHRGNSVSFALTVVLLSIVGGCGPTVQESTSPGPTAEVSETSGLVVNNEPWPSPLGLQAIRAEIERRARGQFTSIGDGAGTVVVDLAAWAEPLAHQIVEAYGPAVSVTVGLFPFPPPEHADPACRPNLPFAGHPWLRATLEMQRPLVVSGETFKATVRLTNAGFLPTTLETSSHFTVYLFKPGWETPIGVSEWGSLGTGLGKDMQPGESIAIPGHGGTASCDLALGYVLPPATYHARALVDFSPNPPEGSAVFWSEPIMIEVVAR